MEKPIVEFKLWHETEKDHDGLRLEYSTDNGSSWHIVPKIPTAIHGTGTTVL
jgi:hypothetical protein